MGLHEIVSGPLAQQVAQRGLPIVIAAGVVAFLTLSVILNVLKQVLLKNPHEPPVVFHWVPIIGSTITYGMAPYDFFERNRAKVRKPPSLSSRSID